MSIYVGKDTRLLVQGITGGAGKFHTLQCREYGTNVFAAATGRHAADDVGTVIDHFLGVESADATGKSLHDYGCFFIQEDTHVQSSSSYRRLPIDGIARRPRPFRLPLRGYRR